MSTRTQNATAMATKGLDERLIVEAALFSAGKPITVEQIAENTGITRTRVRKALTKLQELYAEKETSLEIAESGSGKWALQVKTAYAPSTVRLAPMEISPKCLKTLALIAYHQPVLQSELMDMVGAKVYDHVSELKGAGLIRKRVHERSFMLVTTERFPEYFGIPTSDREEIKTFLARKVGIDVPDRDRKGNKKLSSFRGKKKENAPGSGAEANAAVAPEATAAGVDPSPGSGEPPKAAPEGSEPAA